MRDPSPRAPEPGLRAGPGSPDTGRAAAGHADPVAAGHAARVTGAHAARVTAGRAGWAEPAKRRAATLTSHGRRPWRRAVAGITAAGIARAPPACGDHPVPAGPPCPEESEQVLALAPRAGPAGQYRAPAKGGRPPL